MSATITDSMVDHLLEFLGHDGVTFFKKVHAEHGTYSAVWQVEHKYRREDGSVVLNTIPHIVHFDEGMQVRNALRKHPDCKSWTDHDFDNHWEEVVEKCMEKPAPPPPKSFWDHLKKS